MSATTENLVYGYCNECVNPLGVQTEEELPDVVSACGHYFCGQCFSTHRDPLHGDQIQCSICSISHVCVTLKSKLPEHIQEYLFGNPAEKMQGALDLMNYQQGQAAGLLKKMADLIVDLRGQLKKEGQKYEDLKRQMHTPKSSARKRHGYSHGTPQSAFHPNVSPQPEAHNYGSTPQSAFYPQNATPQSGYRRHGFESPREISGMRHQSTSKSVRERRPTPHNDPYKRRKMGDQGSEKDVNMMRTSPSMPRRGSQPFGSSQENVSRRASSPSIPRSLYGTSNENVSRRATSPSMSRSQYGKSNETISRRPTTSPSVSRHPMTSPSMSRSINPYGSSKEHMPSLPTPPAISRRPASPSMARSNIPYESTKENIPIRAVPTYRTPLRRPTCPSAKSAATSTSTTGNGKSESVYHTQNLPRGRVQRPMSTVKQRYDPIAPKTPMKRYDPNAPKTPMKRPSAGVPWTNGGTRRG